MEAKDTVMSDEQIKEAFKMPSLAHPPGWRYKAIALSQAEISFKAGIKEMVEWLSQKHFQDTHSYPDRELAPEFLMFLNPCEDGRLFWVSEEEWQTKSKELGVE